MIFLNLFISHQLIADDYINFSEGDTFESEINFNKTTSGADGFKIMKKNMFRKAIIFSFMKKV